MSSTILTAHAQYASRPADERFPTLDALIATALDNKNLSAERTYNLKDLRVEPAGDDLQLVSPRGAAAFTHWSFGQLARTVGAPAGYLRDNLTPDLAAACLNHGLAESPVGTAANLLVRGANGAPPIIRAATSDTYGRVWDAELYSGAQRIVFNARSTGSGDAWRLPTAWDGEPAGAYAGDRDSFVIMIDGGSIVTDPSAAAGKDGMYRGVMIRNSEVGASSIVIECVLFRFVCGNLMIWGATIDRRFRRRHVGARVLRDVLRELGDIAYRWTHRSAAQDEAIVATLIRHEIAATREAVIDELRAMGATAQQAAAAYDTCEQHETVSPRSFWGAAQGFTRASQDTPYRDERYKLDQLAGLILARGAKVAA